MAPRSLFALTIAVALSTIVTPSAAALPPGLQDRLLPPGLQKNIDRGHLPPSLGLSSDFT